MIFVAGGIALAAPGADSAASASGAIGWTTLAPFDVGSHTYGHITESLSCASASLCVGGDEAGNVFVTTDPTGGPASWKVTHLGTTTGYVTGLTCAPATTFCLAFMGAGTIFTSTNPAASSPVWTETDGLTNPFGNAQDVLTGVSCPTASLCVATDRDGSVLYSTNPTGGAAAWTKVALGGQPMGISCPSASLCVAIDWGGRILTSTNPTGDASAWKAVNIAAGGPAKYLTGVSCASVTLCVALDTQGDAVSATDPTGDGAAWKTVHIDDAINVSTGSISCTATPHALCVVGDQAGDVLTATDPTGNASAWTTKVVNGSSPIGPISCPNASLCAAGSSTPCPVHAYCGSGLQGIVMTATDPTGGAASWTKTQADPYVVIASNVPNSVSCPTVDFCAAVDSYGNAVVSTDPTAAAPTWTISSIDAVVLTGISCPSASLCVAVDEAGSVLTSTNPSSNSPSWTSASIDAANQPAGVSCAGPSFCVVVDNAGETFTSTNPTGGAGAWTSYNTDVGKPLQAISCASTSLCVAADFDGPLVSTNPAAPTPTWSLITGVDQAFDTVSCPTDSFCMIGTQSGAAFSSTNPAGGAAAWAPGGKAAFVGGAVVGVSCASAALCALADSGSALWTSTDPADAPAQWSNPGGALDPLWDSSVSCPTEHVCVAAFRDGKFVVGMSPPSAIAGRASSIGATTARLTGTVNPNGVNLTDCHFVYGSNGLTQTIPCTPAPGSATSDVSVSATVTGLSPQTGYQFAVIAANASASTESPNVSAFTTTAVACVVPNVKGQTLAAAKQAITAAGCKVGTVSKKPSKKVIKGTVISQSPAAGKQLKAGAKVNIVVSKG